MSGFVEIYDEKKFKNFRVLLEKNQIDPSINNNEDVR